jgi:hypothetical protein
MNRSGENSLSHRLRAPRAQADEHHRQQRGGDELQAFAIEATGTGHIVRHQDGQPRKQRAAVSARDDSTRTSASTAQ